MCRDPLLSSSASRTLCCYALKRQHVTYPVELFDDFSVRSGFLGGQGGRGGGGGGGEGGGGEGRRGGGGGRRGGGGGEGGGGRGEGVRGRGGGVVGVAKAALLQANQVGIMLA